ncbi:glycoside hydrolase [Aspergillus insuetus]
MLPPTWTARTAALLALITPCLARTLETSTPQMGWNSYNSGGCVVDEEIMIENAKGLVRNGLHKLGYEYVTADCGWYNTTRDSSGALQWNTTAFPSGGKVLGDKIHGLGLKFGVYSGAGYWQCGGGNKYPGSLGHERADAEAFARWGADSLKYDNCYNTLDEPSNGADFYSDASASLDRHRAMAVELSKVDRDIVYQLCQWGVGEYLGSRGAAIANSWRISVDIYMNWGSIWRITNQAIAYAKYASPGAYPDLDMLIVGLGVLSEQEEKMHFSLWSIFKSPLILGNALSNPIPHSSFQVISNKEVIDINQDPLGKSAELVRRYTEEGYDIYAGELSGGRMVLGIANWMNTTQTVSIDLPSVIGVSSAQARDVWEHRHVGRISQTYRTRLEGHEMRLLVLSDVKHVRDETKLSSYYPAPQASVSGNASVVACGTGLCLPAGSKVTNIGNAASNAAVTFTDVLVQNGGCKTLLLDYINYDIAWESSWKKPQGTSSRNVTISVNSGPVKRWALPISGGSWFDTGRLALEVSGFEAGNNTVEFRGVDGMSGFAPDLVGFTLVE